MKTHPLKRSPQILGIVEAFQRLDQHIIQLRFHCETYHPCKLSVQHPLIGGFDVDKTEGHDGVGMDIIIIVEKAV